MQTTLKAFSFLSILLFCSCSNSTDTAQVPDMVPAISEASKSSEKEVPPSAVMLEHQDLFENKKSKKPVFAGDPLLAPQGSLDEFDTGEALNFERGDFSQDIIPLTK